MTILHLAHCSDWQAALESGEYRTSTRDATLEDVGFIHASYPPQLAAVAEFIYSDDTRELCVLLIDEELVAAAGVLVIDEDGGNGEPFPHVYGPIRPSWVIDVRPARFDADGSFQY